MVHNKLWKILKEMGLPDHLICLLQRFPYRGICMQVKKQQLELEMEEQTGSKEEIKNLLMKVKEECKKLP